MGCGYVDPYRSGLGCQSRADRDHLESSNRALLQVRFLCAFVKKGVKRDNGKTYRCPKQSQPAETNDRGSVHLDSVPKHSFTHSGFTTAVIVVVIVSVLAFEAAPMTVLAVVVVELTTVVFVVSVAEALVVAFGVVLAAVVVAVVATVIFVFASVVEALGCGRSRGHIRGCVCRVRVWAAWRHCVMWFVVAWKGNRCVDKTCSQKRVWSRACQYTCSNRAASAASADSFSQWRSSESRAT